MKKIKLISLVLISLILVLILAKSITPNTRYLEQTMPELHVICDEANELINVSELSDEFMEEYYNGIAQLNEIDDKENVLIVISKSSDFKTYGATKVVNGPNNQYYLQYENSTLRDKALENLKKNKDIVSVEENGYCYDEATYDSWGIEAMGLDGTIELANTKVLNDVEVAVLDTGCNVSLIEKYYPEKIVGTYNVLNANSAVTDTRGHGTHVTGIVCDATPDNVKVYPIQVSNTGSISFLDIIAAINYVVCNTNCSVMNMSFGGTKFNTAYYQACEAAKDKGIINIAAAGNNKTDVVYYPGGFDNTISISSVNKKMEFSSFSNYGTAISFCAPGSGIKSVMASGTQLSISYGNNSDDDHEIISGTSMSAPHVAAVAAILKSYNKDFNLDSVMEIFKENAIDLGDERWDPYFGYGMISTSTMHFYDEISGDDIYGIYTNLENPPIQDFEIDEIKFNKYNYYSITNLLQTSINVTYTNQKKEILKLDDIENLEILDYDPNSYQEQTITIKIGDIQKQVTLKNPEQESGWEIEKQNGGGGDGIVLTGYKNNEFRLKNLYLPDNINLETVISISDNLILRQNASDFNVYQKLYIPQTYNSLGSYNFSGSSIKEVIGNGTIEIREHCFEGSDIEYVNVSISNVLESGFENCYSLKTVTIDGTKNEVTKSLIDSFAFRNCYKLSKVKTNKNPQVTIEENAFSNCEGLYEVDFNNIISIQKEAFSNTPILNEIDLKNCKQIQEKAFIYSGIKEIIAPSCIYFGQSCFEDCKSLTKVSIDSGKIEQKAFWQSSVSQIELGSGIINICDDSFGYCNLTNTSKDVEGQRYDIKQNVGIIDKQTNEILFGFSQIEEIPSKITSFGKYAFSGNSNLTNIKINENIVSIGEFCFESCINIENIFIYTKDLKTYETSFSNIGSGLVYVFKDSNIKEKLKDYGTNYRQIDPDEIVVNGLEDEYRALTTINESSLSVTLVYNEEQTRKETLREFNNDKGFYIEYLKDNQLNANDETFILHIKNEIGYEMKTNVDVNVYQITPYYTLPQDLTIKTRELLKDVSLPAYFEWMEPDKCITSIDQTIQYVKYVPHDVINYATIENIEVEIEVLQGSIVIEPKITIDSKTFDNTNLIDSNTIHILDVPIELEKTAKLIDINAGEQKAIVTLKISQNDYGNYIFDNSKDTKEFEVSVIVLDKVVDIPQPTPKEYVYNSKEQIFEFLNIEDCYVVTGNIKTNAGKTNVSVELLPNYVWSDNTKEIKTYEFEIKKADFVLDYEVVENTFFFDGNEHQLELNIPYQYEILYSNGNEYVLEQMPKYTQIGEYEILFKAHLNDNYNDYYANEKLIICKKQEQLFTLSGTITTYGNTNDKVTIVLKKQEEGQISTQSNTEEKQMLEGNLANYNFENLEAGNYLLVASKDNHVLREYEVTLNEDISLDLKLGLLFDIVCDGKINSTDLSALYKHINGTKFLSPYALKCANIVADSNVNSTDLSALYRFLNNK